MGYAVLSHSFPNITNSPFLFLTFDRFCCSHLAISFDQSSSQNATGSADSPHNYQPLAARHSWSFPRNCNIRTRCPLKGYRKISFPNVTIPLDQHHAPHTWRNSCPFQSTLHSWIPIRNVPRLRNPYCLSPVDRTKVYSALELDWVYVTCPWSRIRLLHDSRVSKMTRPSDDYASVRKLCELGDSICLGNVIPSSLGGLRSPNLCKPRPVQFFFPSKRAVLVLACTIRCVPQRYHA